MTTEPTVARPAGLDALLDHVAAQLQSDDPIAHAALSTLRGEIGDALVEAGGMADTFPVVVHAQAGVLADAVLAALPYLLAAHARELANAQADHVSAVNASMRENRDRSRVAYCAGMTEVVRGLNRYADALDAQAVGGDR